MPNNVVRPIILPITDIIKKEIIRKSKYFSLLSLWLTLGSKKAIIISMAEKRPPATSNAHPMPYIRLFIFPM